MNMSPNDNTGEITFTTINTYDSWCVDSPSDIYGGCQKCHHYSMVFGGDTYDKTHKKIKTEEDFEVVKSDFVEHFNKAHPDLVAKKRAAKPVKKKFEKMEDKISVMSTPSRSGEFFADMVNETPSNQFYNNIARMMFSNVDNCSFTIQSVEEPPTVGQPVIQRSEERRGEFRSRRTNRYEVQ